MGSFAPGAVTAGFSSHPSTSRAVLALGVDALGGRCRNTTKPRVAEGSEPPLVGERRGCLVDFRRLLNVRRRKDPLIEGAGGRERAELSIAFGELADTAAVGGHAEQMLVPAAASGEVHRAAVRADHRTARQQVPVSRQVLEFGLGPHRPALLVAPVSQFDACSVKIDGRAMLLLRCNDLTEPELATEVKRRFRPVTTPAASWS